MKKIMIIFGLLALLMIGSVNAYFWRSISQDGNQGLLTEDANIFGVTYDALNLTLSGASTYSGRNEPLIGNFYPEDGSAYPEILTYGSCGLALYNGINFSLISTSDSFCDIGYTIDGVAIADKNNDGEHEVIVAGSGVSSGMVELFEFLSDGSFNSLYYWNTPYPHTGRFPVCYANTGYCFVNDIQNNLHRFTLSSYAYTSTSYGAFASDTTSMPMLYDECKNNIYTEIVIAGDLDDDGYVDDIVLIEDGSMTIKNISYSVLPVSPYPSTYEIVQPPTCGNNNASNQKYIAFVGWEYYYSTTYILLLNENFGVEGTKTHSFSSDSNRHNPSQLLFDVGRNASGSETDRAIIHFGAYDSRFHLYSLPDFTLIDSVYVTETSHGNFKRVINLDVNHNSDAEDDVMNNIGRMVTYDRDADTLTNLGRLPSAYTNNADYIVPFSDTNSYADFWIVDSTLGDFFLYGDETTNATAPTPLPLFSTWVYFPYAQPNATVQINLTISDDNPPSEVLSAFDCDSDGSLEFGWGYRGKTPQYNCTYASIGNYTMTAYASDDDNYPARNTSDTNEITIEFNTMPTILSLFALPDPQSIGQVVEFTATAGDDGVNSDIRMAFDCENDGSLEYNWDLYTESFIAIFNCTYGTAGVKTGRLYLTDTYHNDSNVTGTETVEIVSGAVEYNCTGFIDPSCTGDCWFFDDFSYSNDIRCNGWSGMSVAPTSGLVHIALRNSTDRLIYDGTSSPISQSSYSNFSMDFYFINNDYRTVYLYLKESSGGKIITYGYWNTNEFHVIDQTAPSNEIVCTYSDNESVSVSVFCDFNDETCDWTCKGNTETMDFYDTGVTGGFGYFLYEWVNYNEVDFKLDNVLVETGSVATGNATEETNITEGASYLDTGNFCAIDWENHTFIESECEVRGYSDDYVWLQMCLVRACFNDGFTYLYTRAQANIVKTLVIIIVIILIAPLLMVAYRKMRK